MDVVCCCCHSKPYTLDGDQDVLVEKKKRCDRVNPMILPVSPEVKMRVFKGLAMLEQLDKLNRADQPFERTSSLLVLSTLFCLLSTLF